jgi:hypothetical protein
MMSGVWRQPDVAGYVATAAPARTICERFSITSAHCRHGSGFRHAINPSPPGPAAGISGFRARFAPCRNKAMRRILSGFSSPGADARYLGAFSPGAPVALRCTIVQTRHDKDSTTALSVAKLTDFCLEHKPNEHGGPKQGAIKRSQTGNEIHITSPRFEWMCPDVG